MAASPRYRVIVYEVSADAEIETDAVIMDAQGEAFHVAVGSLREGSLNKGRMSGERCAGGPTQLCGHLADLIADNATGPPR